MADEEHLTIIRLGLLDPSLQISEIWNEWRKDNPEIKPDLSGAILTKFQLENIDFSNCNLEKVNLNHANLESANLENANLQGAYLNLATLENANFNNANLEGAFIIKANLDYANLEDANLENANLYRSIFDDPSVIYFSSEDLLKKYADGKKCFRGLCMEIDTLQRAYLRNVDFAYGIFQDVDLRNADLRNTNLSWCRFYSMTFNKADLRGAITIGIELEYVNAIEVYFSNSNLRKAKIYRAKCEGYNFSNVNLKRARIIESNLDNCMLIDADLRYANLSGSSFKNADLTNANLTGAKNFNPENAILNNTILPDGTIGNNISQTNK